MDAVKRVRPVSAVIAALAAVIAVLVATSSRTSGMAPPAKVSVNASFNRQAVEFGDRVDARIVVLGDRKALGSSRIRLEPGLSPLTQLSRSRVTRTSRGSTIVYTVDVPVACLDDHCVAARRRSRVVHPAGARVRLADGTTVAAPWPSLEVRGRVVPADLAAAAPSFHADTTPPAVDYRVPPAQLARWLTVLAALLAAAGALVAGRQVASAVAGRRRRADGRTALELAVALAREAERRPSPDRRRALGLLARVLDRRDERLATDARELAWSRPAPTTDELTGLVEEIEREVDAQ